MQNNDLFNILTRVTWPKKLLFLSTMLLILNSIGTLIIPLFTGKVVDWISTNKFNTHLILLFLLFFLFNTILQGFTSYILSNIGEKIIYLIRLDLWKHIILLKYDFFDKNDSGKLMSRITDDTNIINSFISERVPSVVPSLLILCGSIIMLLILDWQMTILTFLILPIFLAIILPLGKKMESISIKTQNESSEFSGLLGRVLTEIKLVKISTSENIEIVKSEKNLKQIYDLGLKEAKIKSILSPISGLVMMITISIILGFGGYRVSTNAISAGTLVTMIFYVVQLTAPILNIGTIVTDYKKALGASKRISQIYTEEKEFKQNYNDIDFREFKFESIRFEGVKFQYNNTPVLNNLSFDVSHGDMVAIVGPSGSGKTTLFNLMERLYHINEGSIIVNGMSLYDIPLDLWRRKIGYVMQDNSMMSGKVIENLTYGLNYSVSMENIIESTKLSFCYEFINKLPDKFDAVIGERGNKLSGGQKQRIDIARSFIKNPDILLLDEATSNLDSESEMNIRKSLESLMKNRTTFIIAHRLATIKKASKIIFLDNGTITGLGSHEELFENHKKYKRFVLSQKI
ncbi:ABC transporter ATP-binding protein [Staphylococcus hyicus]|uniref:ABC transporter ATP-binding protein n=1 Tax=Staphylococcus hyicus TaxID=1284 RepID=A0A418JIR5_STAHY|nr:ABC transporter ATP-binding protein [Staphylococcus hyicus]MCE5154971.1 ABC transporter ATP-binding protein [Staphylococcus hyicus]RIO45633.1 ABC transporter ATP-binding protein [Staphylococcus hyicus]